jgi:hypothetical protein
MLSWAEGTRDSRGGPDDSRLETRACHCPHVPGQHGVVRRGGSNSRCKVATGCGPHVHARTDPNERICQGHTLGAPRRGGSYRDKGRVGAVVPKAMLDGHDLKGKVPGLEAAVENNLGQLGRVLEAAVKTDLDPTIRLETQASQAYFRPRNDKIAQTQTEPPKNNQPESSFGCHHVVCAFILHCPTGRGTYSSPALRQPDGSAPWHSPPPACLAPSLRPSLRASHNLPASHRRHSVKLPAPQLVHITCKPIRLPGLPAVNLNAGSTSWFVLSLMLCTIHLQSKVPRRKSAGQTQTSGTRHPYSHAGAPARRGAVDNIAAHLDE